MKRLLALFPLLAALLAVAPADAAPVIEADGVRISQRDSGDVVIQGTDADDPAIFVVAGADGQTAIRVGADDADAEVFSGTVRNLTVRLRGGNDSIDVRGVSIGNVSINTGSGGDTVTIVDAVMAGRLTLQMGSSPVDRFDLVYLLGATVDGDVAITGTAGFNGVIIDDTEISGMLDLVTGGGPSMTEIDDSTMAGLRATGGADRDAITVNGSNLGADPTVLTSGGNDSVIIRSSSHGRLASIQTGTGNDYVDFSPGEVATSRLQLRTGAGDDIVDGDGTWVPVSSATGGPGTDSFQGRDDGINLFGFESITPLSASVPEMVVTANPAATDAAALVLRQGGSAVDAMIAAQSMLGLVEPQSSGIGGGAFVVYYDAATGQTTTFDAREMAPSAATGDRFAGLGFFSAWQSGLSVGVPGVPRLMADMQERFGRLPLGQSLAPAGATAIRGFELSGRTSDQVNGLLSFNPSCEERLFFRDQSAFDYFANPDCTAKPAGTTVHNVAYAETLSTIGRTGADGFYEGSIADRIAAAVQSDPAIPGDMTAEDLANYVTVERQPVCINYRGHDVCGMGPPSSGGLTVGQILGILQSFDLGDDPLDEATVHLVTQAGRLAFADRNLYIGDSDFVTVPADGMLDPEYLASRAALIGEEDMGTAAPGVPPGDFDPAAPDGADLGGGTSHLVVVDRWGNALSMTTSIESSFGNGVMVDGFLLNNELTDFSFSPTDDEGTPIANRVQPGKRPRSSMSPTIVFDDDGAVKLLTGSPGGSRIIGYTAQAIMNVLDFNLSPQAAVMVPHYLNRNGSTNIETPIPGVTDDYDAEALKAALEARGQTVQIRSLTSGLSMILVDGQSLSGGADLRRDGTVGGRGQ